MPEPVKTRTAGPWRQSARRPFQIYRGDDEDEHVATCFGGTHVQSIANAATIVQAVNSHEAMKEALMLAEKADRIHSKCQECEDGAQAPEACGDCFPSADDARVARRNVLKTLGILMRDVDRTASLSTNASNTGE